MALWGFLWGGLWGGAGLIPWEAVNEAGGIPAGKLDAKLTAFNRLYKQWEERDNWQKLMSVVGEEFGNVNKQQGEIKAFRYISTAAGQGLDDIGEVVGRSRAGLDDDDYRLAIIAEAVSLFSSGTVPEILGVIAALLPAVTGVEFVEKFPASWTVCIVNLTPELFDLLLEILADQPAAGVSALLCTFDPPSMGARRSISGSGGGQLGSRLSISGISGSVFSLHHHAEGI